MSARMCKYCGCTDAQACTGGCEWVDDTRTLCSSCLFAAEIAGLFVMALGAVPPLPPGRTFDELPIDTLRPAVIAARHVLDRLRASFTDAIADQVTAAAIEHAELVRALADRYPEQVARALEAETPLLDLVLQLLETRPRLVLASSLP